MAMPYFNLIPSHSVVINTECVRRDMDLRFITEDQAEEMSSFIRPMWVDLYTVLNRCDRSFTEARSVNWIGPDLIRDRIRNGFFYAYVLENGLVVGMMAGGVSGEDMVVSKVYIEPEYRGKGYGRECVCYMIEYGREHGCRRAILEVNPRNYPAQELYRSLGFVETGKNQYEAGFTIVMSLEY